jgi:hypothetical protein
LAFTYTKIGSTVYPGGKFRVVLYSYVNDGGSTGGAIATNMSRIVFCKIAEKDSAAMAALATINTTLPTSNSVTIVTTANKSGYVKFIGV